MTALCHHFDGKYRYILRNFQIFTQLFYVFLQNSFNCSAESLSIRLFPQFPIHIKIVASIRNGNIVILSHTIIVLICSMIVLSAGSQSTLLSCSLLSHFAASCSFSVNPPLSILHQKQCIVKWNFG